MTSPAELPARLRSDRKAPAPGNMIVVWFSSGAASAVAAKMTVEQYGSTCDVRLVNNPVREEDPFCEAA